MGLRIKHFLEGVNEKPIYREENCLKMGGGTWAICRFKGGWAKKRKVLFFREGSD